MDLDNVDLSRENFQAVTILEGQAAERDAAVTQWRSDHPAIEPTKRGSKQNIFAAIATDFGRQQALGRSIPSLTQRIQGNRPSRLGRRGWKPSRRGDFHNSH